MAESNLLLAMLLYNAELRPRMTAVKDHPLWWEAAKQVEFLCGVHSRCVCRESTDGSHEWPWAHGAMLGFY